MPKLLPSYDIDIEKIRPFSDIRLIALDLDGTLLKSNNSQLADTLSDYVNKIRYLSPDKVHVTIATGRTLAGSQILLDRLPVPKNTPIILYNGSVVLNESRDIIYQKKISTESCREIINVSSKFNVKVLAYVCSCNQLGGGGVNECAFGWSSEDRPETEYNNMPVKWLEWDQGEDDISPSAVVIHTFGNKETVENICSMLKGLPGVALTKGGNTYIEVGPRGSNKALALEYVASSLKLSRKHVLAMGDNDNDAQMLKWAGIGIAVRSASELATKNSDYISKGVIEGAIEVLRLVKQSKRLLG